MARTTRNTPIKNSTIEEIRAVIVEYRDMLLSVGLVQADDTGQMNLATVGMPGGSNASYGYLMFRFNDPLQSAFPIFIRVEVKTQLYSASGLLFYIQVGTQTNGAGTFIGGLQTPLLGTTNPDFTTALRSQVTNYMSRACAADGYAWMMFKRNAHLSSTTAYSFFMVARSCDENGNLTGDGFTVYRGANGAANGQALLRAGIVSVTGAYVAPAAIDSSGYSMVPFSQASASVGIHSQAYKHYAHFPRVVVNPFIVTVDKNQLAIDAEFDLEIFEGAPRAFIHVGDGFGNQVGLLSAANHTIALPWDA